MANIPHNPDFITARAFRRSLSRTERTTLRHSGAPELEELREELETGQIDLNDPVIRELVLAIPGVGPIRVVELLGW